MPWKSLQMACRLRIMLYYTVIYDNMACIYCKYIIYYICAIYIYVYMEKSVEIMKTFQSSTPKIMCSWKKPLVGSFDQGVLWNISKLLWKSAYTWGKKSDNGMFFNFPDQSVTRPNSWKLLLDKISHEIRSNFLDVRATEKFPGKILD